MNPPPSSRALLATLIAWAALGVTLAFVDRPLSDAIWVLTLGVWALYVLAGCALWITVVLRARRHGWPRALALAIAVVPAFAFALWSALPKLARAGDDAFFARRFARLRPTYLRLAREHARNPTHGDWRTDTATGVLFQVDAEPTFRVAFLQPGSLLDNWEGVVYDPSGRVATATGWRAGMAGNYSAAPDVVRAFGGDLVACESLGDAFYRCWFT